MNNYNCTNDTISDCTRSEDIPQVPLWILAICYVFLAIGSAANLVHVFVLFRTNMNGALSLILQLSLIDIASIYVGLSEIVTLNKKTWPFSTDTCPFFTGSEVLINSLTLYLIICFNFHVISLRNFHELEIRRNPNNPLTRSGTNDESNECLVTKQENTNRMVTIDYRKRKTDLSIFFPAMLMWFVSLSLSIPNFTLSTTLRISENYTLCAVIDLKYAEILQHLILAFKVLIPTTLLIISLLILFIICIRVTQSNQDLNEISSKKYTEIRSLVKFAIALTLLYLVTSFQRQILHFLHTTTYSFSSNNIDNFRMSPLYNSYTSESILTYLSMLHYSSSTFRAILTFCLFPKFRFLVKTKTIGCCLNKK